MDPLEVFGALLMHRVRDKAIVDWDKILNGEMKGTTADQARRLLAGCKPEDVDVLRALIPAIVDTTLHHLLWALDQDDRLVTMVTSDDSPAANIAEASDGLPGELYGDRGWIARLSQQRRFP